MDNSNYKAYIDGEELKLTLKEFELLVLLMSSGAQVLTRDMILNKVWGYDYFGDTRVIDAHMKNIRKKIKKDYIKTIKGVGYVLEK